MYKASDELMHGAANFWQASLDSGGSRTNYLGGHKVGVVSFNESGQIFESKKYHLIGKAM